jgi:hypothetical protein
MASNRPPGPAPRLSQDRAVPPRPSACRAAPGRRPPVGRNRGAAGPAAGRARRSGRSLWSTRGRSSGRSRPP